MKISGIVGISRYGRCITICENLIRGPLRALKALKALKKAQIGVQIGGPLCEKTERDRGMKISGFVDLD